jgi:type II secretory pathway pseudopilin PulG
MKPRSSPKSAFTLVEVVLAILIISGIMTVLLYFYHRAAMVRQAALQEAEFLATTRMFFEQLSSELRTARAVEDQFIGLEGTSNSLTFVCTSVPQMARWITSTNELVTLPPTTDLKRVTYQLIGGTNLLQPRGLDRREELLLGSAFTSGTNATEFVEVAETNLTDGAEASATNLVVRRLPLTDKIQHLQFRYWQGTNWIESWSGLDLPAGIEVMVAKDSMPTEGLTEGEIFEIFRRVIYLPNSDHPENVIVPETLEEALF